MDHPAGDEFALLVQTGGHYEHAPILEAVVEIRVTALNEPGEALRTFIDDSRFELASPEYEITAEVEMNELAVESRADRKLQGYRFKRDDEQRAVRALSDRLAFSWLHPYSRWEEFIEEAEGIWLKYRAVRKPERITRIAVRFINKIDIQKPVVEVRDYLRTGIDISPYLPQSMASFLMHVDIPLSRFDATARIISTMVPPPTEGVASLILDIDVWREVDIDLSKPDASVAVKGHLEQLRVAKNYVFEACITDATRGVIQ